jgi:uncharacterized membrane protein HdeD (DUF308 family)
MTEIPTTHTAQTDPAWASPVREQEMVSQRDGLFPWWMVLFLGVISTVFGIAVLVWPGVSLRVLAVLVGVWLLLAGILRIVGAFLPGRGLGRQVLSGIVGVIILIAGTACLRNLVNALAVLALMVALTWLFSGLAETVMAFQATGATRTWLLVTGVLSLLVGLVFLFTPGLSLAALVLMTGISAIVTGVAELVLAFQLRKIDA